jgi:SNF2 family DNA or RNA helicase
LRFALQSREDPSLIIPAAAIWSGQIPPALGYPLRNPHELLLSGLGYAARFSIPLRDGLNRATPDQITLSGPEAYAFLREVAPVLEASGFGILVPPWWNRPGARLGLKLRLKTATTGSSETVSKGLVSLENLVNYEWQLAIGDTVLSREEFNALVDLKSPLVQVRGQWVQLDAEQVEAAIQFWNKQTLSANIDLLDALALGLDSQAEVDGLPVDAVAFDGLLGQWVAQLQGDNALSELALPTGLQATLRPYQRYGYAWLDFLRQLGIGGILADDMGLGKTIQALTLFQHIKEETATLKESGSLPAPILLICPTSVVTNWEKESARFTPGLRALVHQGQNRLRDADLVAACAEHDLILTSFALALRDGATLREISWLAVVLDEAQHIKNPNAKRTRMIRSFSAQFRLSLTGTPVENRLAELWSIMHFLNPGYLGSQKRFRQAFAIPIERHNDEDAARRLRQLTQPFILRRMKTDPTVITDLPEKQEMKVYVHLSPEQATLYESVVQDTLRQVAASDGMQRRGLVLSLLMKLKQICNHPAQFLHQMGAGQITADEAQRSGKLTRLVDLLETIIAEGDRALIFTQFTEMGGFLQRYLQEQLGLPALYLHGGTPAHRRDSLVERFQTGTDAPSIFLLSLKAGGTGLNLTRANHVFHFDRWWNPAVEDQATDRAFRIGQKRNVLVHKFVCVGTLEERIDEMIEEKKALADSIVGQGEHWLTELSTGDLRDLVKLRQEALT